MQQGLSEQHRILVLSAGKETYITPFFLVVTFAFLVVTEFFLVVTEIHLAFTEEMPENDY